MANWLMQGRGNQRWVLEPVGDVGPDPHDPADGEWEPANAHIADGDYYIRHAAPYNSYLRPSVSESASGTVSSGWEAWAAFDAAMRPGSGPIRWHIEHKPWSTDLFMSASVGPITSAVNRVSGVRSPYTKTRCTSSSVVVNGLAGPTLLSGGTVLPSKQAIADAGKAGAEAMLSPLTWELTRV
ncbi:hypothetical protein K439DRAFT_1618028 [Ramaria rubella]|nr:hypothetical protein K439DRAFT_1618028 [Ramaria rubella]